MPVKRTGASRLVGVLWFYGFAPGAYRQGVRLCPCSASHPSNRRCIQCFLGMGYHATACVAYRNNIPLKKHFA